MADINSVRHKALYSQPVMQKILAIENSEGLTLVQHDRVRLARQAHGQEVALKILEKSVEISTYFKGMDAKEIFRTFEEIKKLYNSNYAGMVLKKISKEYDILPKAIFSIIVDFEDKKQITDLLTLTADIIQEREQIPKEERRKFDKKADFIRLIR